MIKLEIYSKEPAYQIRERIRNKYGKYLEVRFRGHGTKKLEII